MDRANPAPVRPSTVHDSGRPMTAVSSGHGVRPARMLVRHAEELSASPEQVHQW